MEDMKGLRDMLVSLMTSIEFEFDRSYDRGKCS
jgi:hypothetical protein